MISKPWRHILIIILRNNMKLRWRILLFCTVILLSSGFGWQYRRYENLENPTEYLYRVSADRVREALKIFAHDKSGALKGGFDDDGQFNMDVDDYYTNRYWTGPREKTE